MSAAEIHWRQSIRQDVNLDARSAAGLIDSHHDSLEEMDESSFVCLIFLYIETFRANGSLRWYLKLRKVWCLSTLKIMQANMTAGTCCIPSTQIHSVNNITININTFI